ncbi:MAG: RHS repeat-associated core domain-containing protein [Nanoarchaeota archaeon]
MKRIVRNKRVMALAATIIIIFLAVVITIETMRVGLQNSAGQAASLLMQDALPEMPAGLRSDSESVSYVYGTGLVGVKKSSGEISYHVQDVLSTNRLVVSDKGQLESRFKAYPYGKQLQKESYASKKQRFTYTGKEDDGHLMYFGARYLDARTGRFMSVDPAGAALASYTYASDNPLVMRDPDGNWERHEPSEAMLRGMNMAISAVFSLGAGLIRGDSFKQIAGNTALGAAAGLGSFQVKQFVGSNANSDTDFLAAGLADNLFSSVRTNAMRNKAPFSHLEFDYLMMTGSYDSQGGLGIGINLARTYDIVSFATTKGNTFNVRQSLGTGIAMFTRSEYGSTSLTRSGRYAGLAGDFGGAIAYRTADSYGWNYKNTRILRHENIHRMQSIEVASFGSGIVPWRPKVFGLNIYGLGDIAGDALLESSFYIGHGLANGGDYGGPNYYNSDADWIEREANSLVR